MEDTIFISAKDLSPNYLEHYGVLGMKWGVRRYQNKDGSLTSAGRKHYDKNGHPYGKNNKTSVLSQTKQERSEYAQKLLSNSGGSRGKTIAKMVAKRIGRGLARSGAATIAGVLIGTAAIPGLMAGSAPVIAGAYAIAGILDVANVTMNLQDTIGTVVRGHDVLKESKKTQNQSNTKESNKISDQSSIEESSKAKQDLKSFTSKKINYEDYRGEKGTTRLSRDLYNIGDMYYKSTTGNHIDNREYTKEESKALAGYTNNVLKGSRKEDRINLVKEFSGTIDGGMYDSPAVTVYDKKNNKILAYDRPSLESYNSENDLRKHYSINNTNTNWVEKPKQDSKLEFYVMGENIGAKNYAETYLKLHPDSELNYNELVDSYEKRNS